MAIPKIHVHDVRTEARRFGLTVNRNSQPADQVEVSWPIKGTNLHAGLLFYVRDSEAVDPVPFVQKGSEPVNNTNAESIPKSIKALQDRLLKLLKEAGHESDTKSSPVWEVHPVNQLFHHATQEGNLKSEVSARLTLAAVPQSIKKGDTWKVTADSKTVELEIDNVLVAFPTGIPFVFYKLDGQKVFSPLEGKEFFKKFGLEADWARTKEKF